MKLIDTEAGYNCTVKKISLRKEIARRLEMLGMTHGTRLQVLNKKHSGTMIIKVRGTRFALGGSFAVGITVELCMPQRTGEWRLA